MIALRIMTHSTIPPLIAVLPETQELLGLSGNDFMLSSWSEAAQANAGFEKHIENLEAGEGSSLEDLKRPFAPTGSIQKVSVIRGWEQKFLAVADKFDHEVERLKF
jgi:hypothetical protein